LQLGIRIGYGEMVNPDKLREDVRELYYKYHSELIHCIPSEDDDENTGERSYYVYEWFTKDTGKVFYVGRGTKSRYRHIISDIKNGSRGVVYMELQDNFGIDSRFVAKDLTNIEADIYEYCWIRERVSEGEILIQFVDMPYDRKEYNAKVEKFKIRQFMPAIVVSDYRRRYFGIDCELKFDTVEQDCLLRTHFLSTGWMVAPYIHDEKMEITKYLDCCGGRVYSSLAKGAKSVIEFGELDYDKYLNLKEKGYQIYHSFHVLDFIRKADPGLAAREVPKKKARPPKFDERERDEMRVYLRSIQDEVAQLILRKRNDFYHSQKAFKYFSDGSEKLAVKHFIASILCGSDAPGPYLRLAKIYRKYGLFEEELEVLKKGIVSVEPSNTSIGLIKERLSKVELFL